MFNGSSRFQPTDNSKIPVGPVVRAWIIVTGIFLLFMMLVYAAGSLPTTPSFAPAEFYETQEWQRIEPEQREQLQNGAIPIDDAKTELVEMGLPVREGPMTPLIEARVQAELDSQTLTERASQSVE